MKERLPIATIRTRQRRLRLKAEGRHEIMIELDAELLARIDALARAARQLRGRRVGRSEIVATLMRAQLAAGAPALLSTAETAMPP